MGNWQKYCIRSLAVLNNADEIAEQIDKPKMIALLDDYDAKDVHAHSLYEPHISDDAAGEDAEEWGEDESDEDPDDSDLQESDEDPCDEDADGEPDEEVDEEALLRDRY